MAKEKKPEKQAPKHALTPEMVVAQWKPGQSGNPKGRPKKRPITDAIWDALQRDVPASVYNRQPFFKGKKLVDMMADRILFYIMKKGNGAFLKEVYERIEGRLKHIVGFGDEEGGEGAAGPININILIQRMQQDPELAKMYAAMEERISGAVLDARGGEQPPG